MTTEQKRKFIIDIAYVLLCAAIVFCAFKYTFYLMLPFVLGFAIAFMLRPFADRLVTKVHMRPRPAAFFSAFVFYVVVGSAIAIVVGVMGSQIKGLILQLPTFATEELLPFLSRTNESVAGVISKISGPLGSEFGTGLDTFAGELTALIGSLSKSVLSAVTVQVTKMPLFLLGFVFTIVSSIYICADYKQVVGFVFKQIPPEKHKSVIMVKNFLVGVLGKVLKAYAVILGITFIELTVGLFFLKVEYFLPIALLIALCDILPLVGSGMFLLPWAVYSFIVGKSAFGAGMLILYAIITFIRNIIEPKIVGDQMGLHPLLTVTSMFVAIRLVGFAGIFIGPIAVMLIKYLNETGMVKLYKNPEPPPENA